VLLSMSLWQATHFFPRVCLLRGESTAVSVFCAEPLAVSPDACQEKNITKMARMQKRHFENTATFEPPEHSQTPVSLDDALAPLPSQTKTSIWSTIYQTSQYIVMPRNRHVVDYCQSNHITTRICTFFGEPLPRTVEDIFARIATLARQRAGNAVQALDQLLLAFDAQLVAPPA